MPEGKCGKMVVPELILHKNGQLRTNDLNESFCIFFGIQREIGDNVGKGIIFSYRMTRWRKETYKDPVSGKVFFYLLQHGFSLLKFSGRGAVHPYQFIIILYLFLKFFENILPSVDPCFSFWIK
jgi:hypothetical protein